MTIAQGATVDPSELQHAKPRKYRNEPIVIDGIRFASKREADRWGELVQMQSAGLIGELRRQVTYRLEVNGKMVGRYTCDYQYLDLAYPERGLVVEDVKPKSGYRPRGWSRTKKLMAACHAIQIVEV